jgi:hypothetical protein
LYAPFSASARRIQPRRRPGQPAGTSAASRSTYRATHGPPAHSSSQRRSFTASRRHALYSARPAPQAAPAEPSPTWRRAGPCGRHGRASGAPSRTTPDASSPPTPARSAARLIVLLYEAAYAVLHGELGAGEYQAHCGICVTKHNPPFTSSNRVVYRKDADRRLDAEHIASDFFGLTFRAREGEAGGATSPASCPPSANPPEPDEQGCPPLAAAPLHPVDAGRPRPMTQSDRAMLGAVLRQATRTGPESRFGCSWPVCTAHAAATSASSTASTRRTRGSTFSPSSTAPTSTHRADQPGTEGDRRADRRPDQRSQGRRKWAEPIVC